MFPKDRGAPLEDAVTQVTAPREKILVLGGAGYIGSRLVPHLRQGGHDVDVVDLCWFSAKGIPEGVQRMDYRDLTAQDLEPYGTVILLAGHSSVPMCLHNGVHAFRNNVRNFVELVDKLLPSRRLIYASSAGVYGAMEHSRGREDDLSFKAKNYYDLTKWQIDQHAQLEIETNQRRIYGLRFGTVNGGSPHLRVDVMLNQMFHSAKTQGKIVACNPYVNRPILGIDDLCRGFDALLKSDDYYGIYNLSSFSGSVKFLANAAADYLGVKIEWGPDTPAYNMDMESLTFRCFGWRPRQNVYSVLESIERDYNAAVKTNRSGCHFYV